MSEPAVFLRTDRGLMPMQVTQYDAEVVLQQLLRDHPALIAGIATTGDSGRLLLVRREMPVRGPSGTSGLSLDHLFVDHAGIPVLIEVKQAHDTRSRREVVAQMLDYAANGSVEWSAEQLRTAAEQSAREAWNRTSSEPGGVDLEYDPSSVLHEVLGVDDDPDVFWQAVVSNLRRGRMRIIFLADRIWPELVRIIEFLNTQMPNLDVLGVELPQYVGTGTQTVYVPRVVGQTSAAIAAKETSTARTRWSEESLLASAEQLRSSAEVVLLRRLIGHVRERGGRFYFGDGASAGMTGYYLVNGEDTPMWNINLAGRGSLYWLFRDFSNRHTAELTDRFAQQVAGLPGMQAEVNRVRKLNWRGWASRAMAEAAADADAVLDVLDAVLGTANTKLHQAQ